MMKKYKIAVVILTCLSLAAVLGAGPMGSTLRQRDRLHLKDGSCQIVYTVGGDYIRDRLRLQDGSCQLV